MVSLAEPGLDVLADTFIEFFEAGIARPRMLDGLGITGLLIWPDALRPELKLREVATVTQGTVRLRAGIWSAFQSWLAKEVGRDTWASLEQHTDLLVEILQVYGQYLYDAGRSIQEFRQLLAHCQDLVPRARPSFKAAWNLLSKWEKLEPTVHRTPMPEPILWAMVALAVSWGWLSWACSAMMCFLGCCRIGEVLKATRAELLTPRDLMQCNLGCLYGYCPDAMLGAEMMPTRMVKDGNFMLTAPLELNPAPASGDYVRSLACLSSAPSVHSLASLELPLLMHGASRTGLLLAVSSQGILDMLSLALDLAVMGALVTARSFAHPGATALAMTFLQPDVFLLLQGMYCLESAFFVPGCSRSGPCMLASDSLQLEVSLLLRRIAHAGPVLLVLSSVSSGVFLLLRSFVRLEMASSMTGVT
ncbi:hypothetical protein AK812_SmicGene32096 [Symbiodinium microadriaticum]|uniref:Uncharacterized protein n=1 Tax=Symbiodinium microadriaticum TaxID=2951 RepID=A0A1Q9CV54_SYMMI|nr:hypothetical protein AK812_SmicGene32096 [Symbiodinium microadriaticum]